MVPGKEGRKAKKIMQEHPFVGEHYREFVGDRVRGEKNLEVRAVVKHADASLVYRRANIAEGNKPDGSHSWIITSDGKQATLHEVGCFIIKRGDKEFASVIMDDGVPRTDVQALEPMLKILSMIDADLEYILWVKIYEWYEHGEDNRHGPFIKTELRYEIHLPPKDMSFKRLVESADLARNVELTNRMLLDGLLDDDPDFKRASQRLGEIASRFETEVYSLELSEIIDTSDKRGMSGNIGGVQVMSWVMCGRVMITMEAPNPADTQLKDGFTVIGHEPPKAACFGYNSITATCNRAEEMVNMISKAWNAMTHEARVNAFGDDKEVRFLGM